MTGPARGARAVRRKRDFKERTKQNGGGYRPTSV